MKFSPTIRRAGGMTLRETVLSLMRVAGFEGDVAGFTRLRIENPISRKDAEAAWRLGVSQRPPAPPRGCATRGAA